MADTLAAEGDSTLAIAAGAGVTPLRRALEKAGFGPSADMFTRRRLNLARMRLEPLDALGRGLATVWADKTTG